MSSEGQRLRAVTAICSSVAAIVVLGAGLLGYFVAYPAVSAYFNGRFAAVDRKVAAMEKQIAAVEKKADQSNNNGIAQLTASLAKANDALARIKDKIDLPADNSAATASLTTLGASVDKVNASLQRLEQAVMAKLSALDHADTDRAVAKIGSSVDSLKADLKGVSDAVAGLRADQGRSLAALDSSVSAIKSGLDAPANAVKADLTTSMNAIKTNLDASMTAIKAGIDDLSKADTPTSSVPAAATSELVVISFAAPNAASAPAAKAGPSAVPRMSVHYDRIGGLNDDGQAAAIAAKLKTLIDGRDGCTIAVSGHADTLGSDNVNLDISKERAAKVAAALKTAFVGQAVLITQAGWGERSLAEWTPNETSRKANRRVDIAVSCKG